MSSAQSRFRELDSLLACDELMSRLGPVDRQHLIDFFKQRNRKSAAQAEKCAPAPAEGGDVVLILENDSIPLPGDAPFECMLDKDSPYWKDPAPIRCQSCANIVLGGGFCKSCKQYGRAPCRHCRCPIGKTEKKEGKKKGKKIRGGRCGLCFGVVYCSVQCQTDDWERHKLVCPGYKEGGNTIDLRYVQGHL